MDYMSTEKIVTTTTEPIINTVPLPDIKIKSGGIIKLVSEGLLDKGAPDHKITYFRVAARPTLFSIEPIT